MFKFPKFEPQVAVQPLPDEDFEVVCRDAQTGFVLLELGAENEFCFYDHPKDQSNDERLVLSGAHRMCVASSLTVDSFRALEMRSWYADAGANYGEVYDVFYRVIRPGETRAIISIERPEGRAWSAAKGTWTYETGIDHVWPTLLKSGLRTQIHDDVEGGSKKSLPLMQYEVGSPTRLDIGPKSYRCLTVYLTGGKIDKPDSLAEYYVADTGRTVYFRRYDGPESHRYEELAGNPTLEHNGIVWRHFYDCLPDHVLVVGLDE